MTPTVGTGLAKPRIAAAWITLQQVGLQGPNSGKGFVEFGAALRIVPLLIVKKLIAVA
ncbi:MAG TPA: hypothetical protein PLK99_07895 [Burkholderiales bacterium]|nr:hypothetical protein [Burkholderiales bacterium]